MGNQVAESTVVDLLYELSASIVNGATLEESLDRVFDSFHDHIPYDRIGYADIDKEVGSATARWAKSNDRVLLRTGYSAPLAGSSLSIVIAHRQPRVLNNLPEYLEHRPQSRSTSLIVKEGIKSSMTCPLFVDDQPIGILFFSSREYDAYTDEHVKLMKEIAMNLALLLMASQRVTLNTTTPQCTAEHDDSSEEMLLSQLAPGMILAEPILLGSGRLLLARGTELTEQSIDRLITLNQRGLAPVGAVHVCQLQP